MGNIKAKPAPRGRSRASGNVYAAERDTRKNNHLSRKNQLPGEIACYSGLDLDGWLQPRNGRWLAFAADGRFLGSHSSDRLGASAIYEATRPGRSA